MHPSGRIPPRLIKPKGGSLYWMTMLVQLVNRRTEHRLAERGTFPVKYPYLGEYSPYARLTHALWIESSTEALMMTC